MCASMRRVVLVFLGVCAVSVAIRSTGSDKLVRQFNKYILNPFALWVVARRPMYYGVVHHVGRHSGRTYSTPVVAKLTPSGIVIPLPYGAETDWCRNLLSAGHGTVTLQGTDYAVENPSIVGADVAGPLVPAATARVWQWMGIDKFLCLKLAQIEKMSPAAAA